MERARPYGVLVRRCLPVAGFLLAYHVLLRLLMRRAGLRLGSVTPELAPLYAYWRPHLGPWLLVPIAMLAAALVVLRRSRFLAGWSDRRAMLAVTVALPVFAAGVALIDGGPRAWIAPMVDRADLEYYGAIGRVGDVGGFLRDYPDLMPTLPMHAQVHPPGAILFLKAAGTLPGGPWAAAAAVITAAGLAVVPVFLWARGLGGPTAARRAAALFAATPGVVLYAATSMDGVFLAPLVATMAAFAAALESRPWWLGALAGLLGALASFFTYSAALALLFGALSGLVALATRPEARGRVVAAGLAAGGGFLAAYLVLWLATGFDPIATLRAAIAGDHRVMAGTRHESAVRHVHLAVGNLVAFGIGAGVPTLATAIPLLWRSARPRRRGDAPALRAFGIAAVGTLAIAAALPVYAMEVERIWIFLTPLISLPAAVATTREDGAESRGDSARALVALLAAQALLTEVLLTTYW